MLTALSVVAALVGTPAALALVQALAGSAGGAFFRIPQAAVISELLFTMTLPLAVGCAVRHFRIKADRTRKTDNSGHKFGQISNGEFLA